MISLFLDKPQSNLSRLRHRQGFLNAFFYVGFGNNIEGKDKGENKKISNVHNACSMFQENSELTAEP